MVQPAAPPARVVLCVAYRTDPGLDPDKQVNEDACAARDLPLGHLLVVCDGMGGHAGGKEASNRAIRTIFADLEAASPGSSPAAALKAAIEHAGQLVFELGGAGNNLLRPGSTVVALLSHAGGTEVAHVGDSRAYLMRAGQIYPLTRDHSMVQQMVDAGLLKPEDAIGHPDANKITRALGMTATPEVELRPTPLAHLKDDIFLLASDGLCDLVMPNEMLNVTLQARRARGLDFACEQLVSLANARGGHDNITVLLGEVTEAPDCPQVHRTVVAAGPAGSTERPPRTLPEVPAASAIQGVPAELSAAQAVQKTMVDETSTLLASSPGAPTAPAQAAGSDGRPLPPPTWVLDDTDPDSGPTDKVASRRLFWLAMGTALVLFGLALIVLSLWWALAGVSFRLHAEPVALSPDTPARASPPGEAIALGSLHCSRTGFWPDPNRLRFTLPRSPATNLDARTGASGSMDWLAP